MPRAEPEPRASLAHVLKVRIVGLAPPVFRTLVLPSDATIETLHATIQAAFGWLNSHLHRFDVGRAHFEDVDGDPEASRADERRVTIANVLPRVGDTVLYTYNFGDDWVHRIDVLEVRHRQVCIARRAMAFTLDGWERDTESAAARNTGTAGSSEAKGSGVDSVVIEQDGRAGSDSDCRASS